MARNGTKQANGSGTIKQRANGTWEGRYTYYDDYGRPARASVYAKTKTECRKKLTAAMSEVDTTGTHAQYERCTYGEWVRQWLNTYSVNWKPNTRRNYEEKFQKHILPKLGHLQLTHITPIMCQRFINDLAGTELSPKSIKNLHSMIHSSLGCRLCRILHSSCLPLCLSFHAFRCIYISVQNITIEIAFCQQDKKMLPKRVDKRKSAW